MLASSRSPACTSLTLSYLPTPRGAVRQASRLRDRAVGRGEGSALAVVEHGGAVVRDGVEVDRVIVLVDVEDHEVVAV